MEESAKEIHVALSNIQQDGQTLTFNIDRVNVYELKNWLREVNLTTGVRLEKMDLTPVDHLSDVKAQIKLSGESGMNSLTLLQGSQMPALPAQRHAWRHYRQLSGGGGRTHSPLIKEEEGPETCCFRPPTVPHAPTRSPVGKYPGSELVLPAWALPLLPDCDPAASAVA